MFFIHNREVQRVKFFNRSRPAIAAALTCAMLVLAGCTIDRGSQEEAAAASSEKKLPPVASVDNGETDVNPWPSVAAHPRFPRGAVDEVFLENFAGGQPTLETVLHGPSASAGGELNFVGALRRTLAKCGYTNLKSFQKVDLAVER